MALTANREVDRYVDQELRRFGVDAGVHVYKGGFVGLNGGFARPLVAGDRCVGIAYDEANNSSGAAGGVSVRVYTQGDFEHALTGAAAANIGDAVYASADDELTFTASGNSLVGACIDVPSAGRIVVRLGLLAPSAS
jgi:hypothetical protein